MSHMMFSDRELNKAAEEIISGILSDSDEEYVEPAEEETGMKESGSKEEEENTADLYKKSFDELDIRYGINGAYRLRADWDLFAEEAGKLACGHSGSDICDVLRRVAANYYNDENEIAFAVDVAYSVILKSHASRHSTLASKISEEWGVALSHEDSKALNNLADEAAELNSTTAEGGRLVWDIICSAKLYFRKCADQVLSMCGIRPTPENYYSYVMECFAIFYDIGLRAIYNFNPDMGTSLRTYLFINFKNARNTIWEEKYGVKLCASKQQKIIDDFVFNYEMTHNNAKPTVDQIVAGTGLSKEVFLKAEAMKPSYKAVSSASSSDDDDDDNGTECDFASHENYERSLIADQILEIVAGNFDNNPITMFVFAHHEGVAAYDLLGETSMSGKECAEALGVSESTVSDHKNKILSFLAKNENVISLLTA